MPNFELDEKSGLFLVRESITLPSPTIPTDNVRYLQEATADTATPNIIFPLFHALRADIITRNRTCYTKEALMGSKGARTGIYSALRPYRIPYIDGHRTGSRYDKASEVYGRVINAFMVEGALNGASAAAMIIGVPHREAIEQIMNGNWCTVSMGSSTEEAHCGLCGADLMKKPCECMYERDKQDTFYVKIGKKGFKFREISNVLTPSDEGAVLQDPNVDPNAYRLFASDIRKESVYDLSDPNRTNLLQSPIQGCEQEIAHISQSIQWLLDEFAPKRTYSFATPKETSMPPVNTAELPDSAFGVIYTETASMKRLRRFPFALATTPETQEALRTLVLQAKDLDADQQQMLLSRLDSGEAAEPLMIEINQDNYTCLVDVVDSLRDEQTLIQAAQAVSDATPVASGAPEEDTTEAVVETPEVPAPIVETEVPTEETSHTREEELTNELTGLYAEIISRQKFALHEPTTKGQELETFTARYQTMNLESLRVLYQEYLPTFGETHVDVTHIETVESPVAEAVAPLAAVEPVAEEAEDEVLVVPTAVTRMQSFYKSKPSKR